VRLVCEEKDELDWRGEAVWFTPAESDGLVFMIGAR
jgi:hypothetical protein